jgi:predicted dehydrogenase
VNVGVVGCGVISRHYLENSAAFDAFELVACADLDAAQAAALALPAREVDELLADPQIDAILDLTPAVAHGAVNRAALAAGKHLYTEKPLATDLADAAALVAEANRLELRVGCAPDTFLSGAFQAARALIDEGAIGAPISFSGTMLAGNQQTWHPNPDIFFVDGAGPLLDMGPYYLTVLVALLGPVRRVTGFASTRTLERRIEIGPRTGELFAAATPTHTAAALELESGAAGTLVASFEAHGQYVAELAVHGEEGVLVLPDPNSFGGPLRLRSGRGEWREVPFAGRGARDVRGIGLQDMAEAVAAGRPHRATGELGLHVVEAARGILRSAAEGRPVELETTLEQPAPLPVETAV